MPNTGAKIIKGSKGILVDKDFARAFTRDFLWLEIAEVPAA
tara:strand:- start:277 stop:399 length:123 start_codon:yes stop_codon:yes gene_type:complete